MNEMKSGEGSSKLASAMFYALRAGFRSLPVSEATRDKLRKYFLERFPKVRPLSQKGMEAWRPERRARVQAGGRAIGHREFTEGQLPDSLPAMLVAFYLPQFHSIPENDEWWGQGFTEWRNVARALPQFEGHAQPRLPADLGHYDLRNPQVMRDQVRLAKTYGIGAFCFYFYWFAGKTLLEQPLRQWLDDPSLDFPACICWANENWTRRWDGRAGEVLIQQKHGADDDLSFIAHVSAYMKDARYLRIDGKPLLLVYRPSLLPDPHATTVRWRRWCREHGVGEIYIAYVQSFERPVPSDIGFDAAVEFPPNLSSPPDITKLQTLINPDYRGEILDWRMLSKALAAQPMPDYDLFPGVNCGWDNEPRRSGNGRTYIHASPRGYRDWLKTVLKHRLANTSSRLVFINAWNEWAEGAVLEPDTRLGHAWLKATRDALNPPPSKKTRPCAVVHAWHEDAFQEIVEGLLHSGMEWRLIVSVPEEKEDSIRAVIRQQSVLAEVHVVMNHGRDILPFLRIADQLLDEEDVVLKLHTKRSPHRSDGDQWRRELVSSLIASGNATEAVQSFLDNGGLGLLAPAGHLLPIDHFWGNNESNVRYLTRRLGIAAVDLDLDVFASGSMFWVRLEALRPLLDAHLDEWEFESEAGQLDGTTAHAVERIFTLAVKAAGYEIASTSALKNEVASTTRSYRYAPPS